MATSGFLGDDASPVLGELVDMQAAPLAHEPVLARGQLAGDDLTREVHRCEVLAAARVELRARVRALVPGHPDRDAVEGTGQVLRTEAPGIVGP